MVNDLKVKKWGGENASELIKSPNNIINDYKKGIKQVVVVSAIRDDKTNTTDNLIEIGELLGEKNIDFDKIKEKIEKIRDFHINIAKEKGVQNFDKIKNYIINRFEQFLMKITYNISSHNGTIPNKQNDYLIQGIDKQVSILGIGEIISAEIQKLIINNLDIEGLNAEVVNLNNIGKNINNNDTQTDIFQKLSKEISEKVISILDNGNVPIISGYISGFEKGYNNIIGRGYTDATASITAVGLSKKYNVILEIQKSVEGMLSADPRIVKGKTKLIENIDYLTAKEITGVRGAQAKLLHSQVLRQELQKAGIKIHLFDPFKNTKGTIISRNKSKTSNGIEYIGGRNNITIFSVSSGNMSSKGILSEISLIANQYASIDIVSTSETEISFTIDGELNDNQLKELSNKIRKSLNITDDGYENFVKYYKNKALIFCIGQNLSHNLGVLGKAASSLSNGGINIEMVSQGTMERAIVFGIQGDKMNQAINLLHEEFIK